MHYSTIARSTFPSGFPLWTRLRPSLALSKRPIPRSSSVARPGERSWWLRAPGNYLQANNLLLKDLTLPACSSMRACGDRPDSTARTWDASTGRPTPRVLHLLGRQAGIHQPRLGERADGHSQGKFIGLSSADPDRYGLPRNVGLKHELDAPAKKDFRHRAKTYLPRKLKEEGWLD